MTSPKQPFDPLMFVGGWIVESLYSLGNNAGREVDSDDKEPASQPPQPPQVETVASAVADVAETAAYQEERKPSTETEKEKEVSVSQDENREPEGQENDSPPQEAEALVSPPSSLFGWANFLTGSGAYAPSTEAPPEEPHVVFPYKEITAATKNTANKVKNDAIASVKNTAYNVGQTVATKAVEGVKDGLRQAFLGQPAQSQIEEPTREEQDRFIPLPSAEESKNLPNSAPQLEERGKEKELDHPPQPSSLLSDAKQRDDRIKGEKDEPAPPPIQKPAYIPPPRSAQWNAKGKDKEPQGIPSPLSSSPQSWWTPALSRVLTMASMYGAQGALSILDKFIEYNPNFAKTFPQGYLILDEARHILATGRGDPQAILQGAWDKLKELQQYHVHWGLGVLSPSPIPVEDEEGQKANPSNSAPIREVAACKKTYQELRDQFDLQPLEGQAVAEADTEQVSLFVNDPAALAQAERETGKLIEKFCHNTLHYSVMRAIYTIFGDEETCTPEEIITTAGEHGSIKEEFLSQYGSVRGFFFRIIYDVLLWFIRPLIVETTQKAMADLRHFLKEDPQLIDTKIRELNNYLGKIRVSNVVRDYINSRAGSLDEFLQNEFTTFGVNKFPKEKLIQLFQDYVIENYVPSPEIKVYGWRVIVISPLLEWIVQLIRKQAVRQFLNQSHLIDGMIQQGGNAVFQAKINLMKLLQEKFEDINKRIEDSFLDKENSEEVRLELEAKKAALIGPDSDLRILIQNLSHNLLDFIKVEACNDNHGKLEALYRAHFNPSLGESVVKGIADVYQQPDSFDGILELALNHMLETALVTFLEDINTRAESQVQNLFRALNDVYKYEKSDQKNNAATYTRRYEDAKENLKAALEKPISAALQATLEEKLKKSSPEKHKRIEVSVNDEKKAIFEFTDKLQEITTILQRVLGKNELIKKDIAGELEGAVWLIDQHLKRVQAYLNTPMVTSIYYPDTRANIYQAHVLIINHLTALAQHIRQIAEASAGITQCEKLIDAQNDLLFSGSPDQQSLNSKIREIKPKIEQLVTDAGKRQSLEKQLDDLKKFNRQLSIVQRKLGLIQQRQGLTEKQEGIHAQLSNQQGYFPLNRYNAQVAEFQRLSPEIVLLNNALNKDYTDKLKRTEDNKKKKEKTLELLAAVDTDITELLKLSQQHHECMGNRYEVRAIRLKLAGEITALVQKLNAIEDETVRKLLQDVGMGLPAETKELAREVYHILGENENVGYLRFKGYHRECREKQDQEYEDLKNREQNIREKIGKDTEESLRRKEETLNEKIQGLLSDYQENIQGCIADSIHKHGQLKEEIAKIAPQFAETASAIRENVNRFFIVHPFIDMTGDLIYNTSIPFAQDKFHPQIQARILTIVSALGKSFHYEQVGLNLLVAPIANRQWEKVRPR